MGKPGKGRPAAGRDDPKERKPKKTPSPHYQANNVGGFGNPPVKGQFKSGDKGGPGRKKGDTSLQAAMRKILHSNVELANGAGAVPLSEALAMRARKEMLSGSLKGFEMGLKLVERYGPVPPEEATILWQFEKFSSDELGIVEGLLTRALGSDEPEENPDARRSSNANVAGVYRAFLAQDGLLHLERLTDDTWPAPSGPINGAGGYAVLDHPSIAST